MVNVDIANALGQNLANSESCPILRLLWKPKYVISGNMSKNVWASQWPTSSELKINFDPSLDSSWCKFSKIIKNPGPKNPPLSCNLGPNLQHPGWSHVRKRNHDIAVQYEDVRVKTNVGLQTQKWKAEFQVYFNKSTV